MDDNAKRLIIFIIISAGILFLYNKFFMTKNAPASQQQAVSQQSGQAGSASGAAPAVLAALSKPQEKPKAEKTYTLENDLVKVTVSNIGGGALKSWLLKKYSDSEDKKEPLEMIPDKSSYDYMALSSPTIKFNDLDWKTAGTGTNGQDAVISFTAFVSGLEITRQFVLKKSSYEFESSIAFSNRTKSPVALQDIKLEWGPNVHFMPLEAKKSGSGMGQYNFNKVMYMSSNSIKTISLKTASSETINVFPEKPSWIVLRDLYFMSSFIISDPSAIKSAYLRQAVDGTGTIGLNLDNIIVDKSSEKTISFNSYIGPQEYKRLHAIGLEKVIAMGWFREIGVGMFYALEFIYKITHNYGIAIILLTIIIRLILWIPSQNSYKHMKDVQKKMGIIKPRLDTLQKIYKEDPAKLNEETMKLYKEYKINPLGGCLPQLLQLPIFFALYSTLVNMVELKGAGFVGWLNDLSAYDKFYVLPLLMGVTMFIQQKMTTTISSTPEQEQQQKIMMYIFPVFFTFLSFRWPSGLLLYWGVSNVLAIIQQVFVNKSKVA